MKKCRITVVQCAYFPDLVKKYSGFGPEHGRCPVFKEGQTFLCGLEMPEGFCSWAWDDIHKLVFAALGGANFSDIVNGCTKKDNCIIGCCTDGYRPVTFLVETIDDEISEMV